MHETLETPIMEDQIPLQPASKDIYEKKYRLMDKSGEPVDQTVEETYQRVAAALASIELPHNQEESYKQFIWAMQNGAIPAGRIMSNAGAGHHKPRTSLINCTVSAPIRDSIEGIFSGVYEAGRTLSAGCGIGYEFSTLRPRGAFVAGVGASTGGALSFMDVYDRACFTISSAGGRRGAQMGTMDVSHPDVLDFIHAKREDGRLRQFNLSLLITDGFMEAVEADADWPLVFPLNRREHVTDDAIFWRRWPVREDYMLVNDVGEVACRVYGVVKARELWETVMRSTYDYAEPGFLLIDNINRMNNNWWCEEIRATNPCGEQPLPPYGACLLGSINLTKFVIKPFEKDASFDWHRYREVVRVFTRMLDNVVELHGLPLEKQAEEIIRKRRHGMGFLGLGSAMALLGIKYGSAESITFTETVSRIMAVTGWEEGVALAQEKGAAPIMDEDFEVTPEMIAKAPPGFPFGVGMVVPGRVLFAHSQYMQQIFRVHPHLRNMITMHGVRFTHHTSIAPTGTISLSLANNASNGIEPSFTHEYSRNVIREGKKSKEQVTVYSYEALLWKHLKPQLPFPDHFVDTDSLSPLDHIAIQAAAQPWIDSSISKTCNVPTDFPFEQFKDLYSIAYKKGLKGFTTFRFNPEAFQGVLVKQEDLQKTVYLFTLADGSVVECTGDESVFYDGEEHNAANLFDALKEGYYGQF